MTLLACASHLLVDLPLFGGPVVLKVVQTLNFTRSDMGGSVSTDTNALAGSVLTGSKLDHDRRSSSFQDITWPAEMTAGASALVVE